MSVFRSKLSLERIVDLTSGAERPVVQFQQGLYVGGLDWSPDGPQASSGGGPPQAVQRGTDALHVVRSGMAARLAERFAAGVGRSAFDRTFRGGFGEAEA